MPQLMPTIEEVNKTEGFIFDLPKEWQPDISAQAAQRLAAVCLEAHENDHLNLSSLRCICVRQDFVSAVHHWQQSLGLPGRVTVMESGQAMGKAMCWQTENSECRSVIILADLIVAGLLQNISLFNAVMVHELAHVHDECHRFSIDPQKTVADTHSLLQILHELSYILWSEYFADRTARRYYSEEEIQLRAHDAEIVKDAFASLEQKKTAYRTHRNTLDFWQQTVSETSISIGALGRFLGVYSETGDEKLLVAFQSYLPTKGWRGIASDAVGILEKMYERKNDWDLGMLRTLEILIYRAWAESGVFPEARGNETYIDVPL